MKIHQGWIVAAAVVAGCGGKSDAGSEGAGDTGADTGGGESTTTFGTTASTSASSGTSTSATSTSTAGPADTGGAEDTMSFIAPPDGGVTGQCSPMEQDCPEGEKCTAYSNTE